MPTEVEMENILVVDDEEAIREVVSTMLESKGYHCMTVPNGRAAQEQVKRATPDLILSDMIMPEMDGLGLLRAVRGHPAVRKLPFILITGRGDRELVVTAAQAGVNNYLVKPFTEAMLRQKMEEVMGKLS